MTVEPHLRGREDIDGLVCKADICEFAMLTKLEIEVSGALKVGLEALLVLPELLTRTQYNWALFLSFLQAMNISEMIRGSCSSFRKSN